MLRTYKSIYSWTWTMKALPELKLHLFFYPELQKPIVIDFLEPSIFQVGAVVAPGGKTFCQKSLSKCKFRPISGLSLLGKALRSHFFPLQSLGRISHLFSGGEWEMRRGDEGKIFTIRVLFTNWQCFFLTGTKIYNWEQWVSWRPESCHVFSHPRSSFALPTLPSCAWGCTWSFSASHGGTDGKQDWAASFPSSFPGNSMKLLSFSSALMSRLTFLSQFMSTALP